MKQTFFNHLFLISVFLYPLAGFSQVIVTLTVDSGSVATTCTDPIGAPEPTWRVNINGEGWVTYPQSVICFQNPPFLQYSATYFCAAQMPASINVCFRAFENDGFVCNIIETCPETVCQDFNIPAPGSSTSYTLSLPAGASSTGQVNFTIATSGSYAPAANDLICNAIDLGTLDTNGSIGDSSLSQFHNYCATGTGDLNMLPAFTIEQAVWFTFLTGPNPSAINMLHLVSDPEQMGDSIDLEVAVYRSNDGTCNNGSMTLHSFAHNLSSNDVHARVDCLQPNTRYYIEVDGRNVLNQEGYFGLQLDNLGFLPSADLICNAYDFGMIPDGGMATTGMTQNNTCATHTGYPSATAFVIQQSVWFRFIPPPSGHVIIEGISEAAGGLDPVDMQLAVYRSVNNMCSSSLIQIQSQYQSGNFNETIELTCLQQNRPYWILMDGSATDVDGNFEIRISDGGYLPPQSITLLQDTICFGESITIGTSIYNSTDTIFEVLDAWNGCDSVVAGFLYVRPQIQTVTDVTLCFGESLTVGNNTYSSSAVISDTLTSWSGCDSLVSVNLTVWPQNMTFLEDTICTGDFITVGTQVYNSSGPIFETLTDHRGCDSIVTGSLYVIPPIQTVINQTLCAGQSFAVGNQSFNATGNFTIILPSYQGCDSTILLQLNVLPPVIASIAQIQIATDWGSADAVAVAQATGGSGTYTFAWSTGQSTAQVSGLTGGADYCVTATDSFGCLDTACFFAAFNVVFSIPASGDQLTCHGDTDGQLSFTTSNGPGPFFYQWHNEDNSINGSGNFPAAGDLTSINGLPAGIYTVLINNAWYSTQAQVAISEPDPLVVDLLTQSDVSCVGLCDGSLSVSAGGGTPAYQYAWSNGIAIAENVNICAGNYTMLVTDANGCQVTAAYAVLEPALPVQVNIVIADSISCFGGNDGILQAIATGGSGDYQYIWSNNDTTETASGIVSSFYLVTVTDSEGCFHSASFLMPQPPSIDFDYQTQDIDCKLNPTGSILVESVSGGTPGYEIAIDGLPVFQDMLAGLDAGLHEIEVTDQNGCSETDEFLIQDFSHILVEAGNEQLILLGEEAILSAQSSSTDVVWTWTPADNLSCPDCPTSNAYLLDDTWFTVTVMDTVTGCTALDQLLVRVKKDREVFIPNVFSPNNDGINDVLMIFGKPGVSRIRRFAVFDRIGEQVFLQQEFQPDDPQYGWDGTFRGRMMTPGVFVWLAEIEYIDGAVQLFKGDATLVGN